MFHNLLKTSRNKEDAQNQPESIQISLRRRPQQKEQSEIMFFRFPLANVLKRPLKGRARKSKFIRFSTWAHFGAKGPSWSSEVTSKNIFLILTRFKDTFDNLFATTTKQIKQTKLSKKRSGNQVARATHEKSFRNKACWHN